MRTVLTIAGSDCSGGAGIQADIKTITAHGLYASSAITALTVQNTTGVFNVMEVSPQFVAEQIDCIFDDIRPDAVKVGMVSNTDIIMVIAEALARHGATNIVVDPVMVSTSGSRLLDESAMQALVEHLLPLASVITPNIAEAECLTGAVIETKDQMLEAAKVLLGQPLAAVLLKGGHLDSCSDDLLLTAEGPLWFEAKRIENPNTHGTGCTLSSAIACNLAQGASLAESVLRAKGYVTGALAAGLDLGSGSGPLDHCFDIR